MSDTKHTPGPWEYESGSIWSDLAGRIGRADRDNPTTCPTERDANARLMAASPELLAACELALRILDRDGLQHIRGEAWTDGERERLELAVAKAKGE